MQRLDNLILIIDIKKTFNVSHFFTCLWKYNNISRFFSFSRPKLHKSLFYLDYAFDNELTVSIFRAFTDKNMTKTRPRKAEKSKMPIFTPPKPLPPLVCFYDKSLNFEKSLKLSLASCLKIL